LLNFLTTLLFINFSQATPLSEEYFQQDLAEFPNNIIIHKLLARNTPQWQTTIQNNLLWNEPEDQ
jgi:hypothetical protein